MVDSADIYFIQHFADIYFIKSVCIAVCRRGGGEGGRESSKSRTYCQVSFLLLICVTLMTLNESRHEKICLCHLRTTKAQISLCIHAVWSAPLLFAA